MKSDKSFVAMLLFSLLLGYLGVHRFYAGKFITGAIQLFMFLIGIFTFFILWILLGLWVFIDFILIVSGAFTDSKGYKIKAS